MIRKLAFLLLSLAIVPAGAQERFPTRPVKLVVGFPAGSVSDISARAIAAKLNDALGQPVVVENRPGANGALGATHVARSQPDGYTLLLGVAAMMVVAPAISKSLPYHPVNDFEPVGLMGTTSPLFVVNENSPHKTIREFIDAARASPGKLTYGSSSMTYRLIGEMFQLETQTKLLMVPYKGPSEASTDLVGGRLDINLDSPGSAMPLIRSGNIRPLAVLGPQRAPALPDVPTFAESGFPNLVFTGWTGVFAPKGTPDAVLSKLNAAVNRGMQENDIRDQFRRLAIDVKTGSRAEFASALKSDIARSRLVVEKSGIELQ